MKYAIENLLPASSLWDIWLFILLRLAAPMLQPARQKSLTRRASRVMWSQFMKWKRHFGAMCRRTAGKYSSAKNNWGHIKLCNNISQVQMWTVSWKGLSEYPWIRAHQKMNYNPKSKKCRFCEKKFRCVSSLTRHEKTHGTKNLICETCGFAAASRNRLWVHLVIHNEVPRLPCPHCPKRFNYARALEGKTYLSCSSCCN